MRTLLILTTTFFPDPHVGAIRMAQWCRHLPKHGWRPIVACRYYGYRASREALGEAVHPDVIVEYLDPPLDEQPDRGSQRLFAKTSGRLRRFKKFLKKKLARYVALFSVPGPSIYFWNGSKAKTLELIDRYRPDVILTSSPQHGVHSLGMRLAQATGLPWIADFRDVYLLDFSWRYRGIVRLSYPFHARFEKAIYERAQAIIHAIPLHARWASRRYPQVSAKIRLIPNGCPEELTDAQADPIRPAAGRKSIRVIGSVDPADLLFLGLSIADLIREGHDLELCYVGGDTEGLEPLRRELLDRLVTTGRVSHQAALRYITGSDLLISYLNEWTRARSLQLTSKIFEFIGSGTPVIEVNPSIPDRHLLREWNTITIRCPTRKQLSDAIVAQLSRGKDFDTAGRFRSLYSRAQQALRVAELLQVVGQPSRGPERQDG